MNTNTVASHSLALNLERFADQPTLLRPSTRESFERYERIYNRALSQEMGESTTLRTLIEDMGQTIRFVENPLDVIDILAMNEHISLVADTVEFVSYDDASDEESATGYYLDYTGTNEGAWLFVPTDTFNALQSMKALTYESGCPTTVGECHYHTLSQVIREARLLHVA